QGEPMRRQFIDAVDLPARQDALAAWQPHGQRLALVERRAIGHAGHSDRNFKEARLALAAVLFLGVEKDPRRAQHAPELRAKRVLVEGRDLSAALVRHFVREPGQAIMVARKLWT